MYFCFWSWFKILHALHCLWQKNTKTLCRAALYNGSMMAASPISPSHLKTEAEPASETFLLSREGQCPKYGQRLWQRNTRTVGIIWCNSPLTSLWWWLMKCCLHIHTAHTHSLNGQSGLAQSHYVPYGFNADVKLRYVTKHPDKTWLLCLVRQVTDSSLLRNVKSDSDAHTGSYPWLLGTYSISKTTGARRSLLTSI